MSRYHFARRAARDFDTIIQELDLRSRTAAKRVASAIRQQCARYADNPLLGIMRDDIGPNLCCFLAFRYVILYTVVPDGIRIARIFHGHQDIDPDSLA
jgi:plasmid stabilization system protein ParE